MTYNLIASSVCSTSRPTSDSMRYCSNVSMSLESQFFSETNASRQFHWIRGMREGEGFSE